MTSTEIAAVRDTIMHLKALRYQRYARQSSEFARLDAQDGQIKSAIFWQTVSRHEYKVARKAMGIE